LIHQAPAQSRDSERFSSADLGNIVVILALSAAAAFLMWTKVHSLIWFDPALWLQEALRMARGLAPYRDFLWMYPPAPIALIGWGLRAFGEKFEVAQLLIDAVSLLVVVACYLWVRRLFSRNLHAISVGLVIAVMATSQTYFSLFSFLTYGAPSLHFAALGVLVFVIGTLRYLERGERDSGATWLMALGAVIALTSKPESIVVTLGVFAILACLDRFATFREANLQSWAAHYARWALVCFAPAAIAYLAVGVWAGFGNMARGISGNGIAQMSCPWWPTGFGVLSVASALGLAIFVFAVASLAEYSRWLAFLGKKRYALVWTAALAGFFVYASREAVLNHDLLSGPLPLAAKLRHMLPDLLATSAVFLSGLWSIVVYWIWLAMKLLRQQAVPKSRLALLVVLTVPVAFSVRGLFGSLMSGLPEVPAADYPFVLMLTPYVLLRVLSLPHGLPPVLRIEAPSRPSAVVAALMLLYITVRVVGGWHDVLSPARYTALDTVAGRVHVRDFEDTRDVYRYVIAHTNPTDSILEIPWGGGIGFATGRPSYSFTTLWIQVRTPESVQARDLAIIRAHPPRVIVASSASHLGSYYGVMGNNGCTFPCITWMPNRLSWRPGYVYPAIQWIEDNYRIDKRVGEWVLLVPK
jgi:hypothetical protein